MESELLESHGPSPGYSKAPSPDFPAPPNIEEPLVSPGNSTARDPMSLLFQGLECSMKSKANCSGDCEWHGDVCEADAATQEGSAMERVMTLSLECSKKPKAACNGTCEWGAVKKECEIEELTGLAIVGGADSDDFKQKCLACRAYPKEKCTDSAGCGWQEDYGRCSINQGLVMMKVMRGQSGAGALAQVLAPAMEGLGRKLEGKAAIVAVGQGHGNKLRLAGLQPEHAYVAYCVAVEVPKRQCRLGPRMKECAEKPETGRLLQFEGGRDLVIATFTTSAVAGGGALTLVVVIALVVALLAASGFVLANWKRLSRRYWARRIVRPEDNELMACPVGPDGWAALRDGA